MEYNFSLPNSMYNPIKHNTGILNNLDTPRVPPGILDIHDTSLRVPPGMLNIHDTSHVPPGILNIHDTPRVPPIDASSMNSTAFNVPNFPFDNNTFSNPSASFKFQQEQNVFDRHGKTNHSGPLGSHLSWKKRRRPGASNLPKKIFINEEKMAARMRNMSLQCTDKKPWKCATHEEARRIISEIDSRLSSDSDEEVLEADMNDEDEIGVKVELAPELKRKLKDSKLFLGRNGFDTIKPCMELVLYKPPGDLIIEAVAEKLGKTTAAIPTVSPSLPGDPVFDYSRIGLPSTRSDSGFDEDIFEDQLIFDEDEMDF